MDRAAEIARLQPFVARARDFSGWDLSIVRTRHVEPGPPWDYVALAHARAASARRVVDFGTGGGEVLARIAAGLDATFVGTEQWSVNARVAADRLRHQGIGVVRGDSARPPLRHASVDLALSRHEGVDPAEVDRVLAPGGAFLTQQVAPDNWPELRRYFPRATVFADHYHGYAAWFRARGYAVELQRHDAAVAWETLGDLVLNLLICWDDPGLCRGAGH